MCKWNVLSLTDATSLCGVAQDVKNKREGRLLQESHGKAISPGCGRVHVLDGGHRNKLCHLIGAVPPPARLR